MKKVVVIGAGIGGLAAAIRLARQGMRVEVYEASAIPGGKISEFRRDGFRFDTGPSLFTLLELVDDLLDDEFRLTYRKLPVVTRYFWHDGILINSFSDPGEFGLEVEKKTRVGSASIQHYLTSASELYRITAPVFIFNSIHKVGFLFQKKNLPALFNIHKIRALTTMHRVNGHAFNDPKIVQLFDRYATYNGSDPFRAPGTLTLISHLEHNIGAFLPESGIYSLVVACYNQAKKLGVEFHFSSPVEQVIIRKSTIAGIAAGGADIPADFVVSDVDTACFYHKLLPDSRLAKRIGNQERSSSALIFYWGMNRVFPEFDVHNILFSNNYQNEFTDLFEKKDVPDDPTIYLYISSKALDSDAPTGCENWFVMVNAPENVGQDWDALIGKTREAIFRRIENLLGKTARDAILFEKILDPAGIEWNTGSVNGSLYGPSSNSRFSAFRRHPNFSCKYKGLFFTGGSVHPGGGIPLCLSSAKIVADLINQQKV